MTTTTDTRKRRSHSCRARCFLCATDEEIRAAMNRFLCATDEEIRAAMNRSTARSLFARFTRKHPTIHWQGYACPFEES